MFALRFLHVHEITLIFKLIKIWQQDLAEAPQLFPVKIGIFMSWQDDSWIQSFLETAKLKIDSGWKLKAQGAEARSSILITNVITCL